MGHSRSLSIVVIAIAVALSAIALTALSPLSKAGAVSTDSRVPPEEIASLVDDMAPGALVTEQGDGSVAILGALNAEEQAKLRRARALADTAPWVIQCRDAVMSVSCTPIRDAEVEAAVKAGVSGLYNRVIYSIPTEVVDQGIPMFDADELVCGGFQSGAITCQRVDQVAPRISAGETAFMTYRPLRMTFDEQAGAILHVSPSPEVPLRSGG